MKRWGFHRLGKKNDIIVITEIPGGKEIARMKEEEGERDVNLVLAAPRLLEVLTETVKYLRKQLPSSYSMSEHFELLEKASVLIIEITNKPV